MTGLARCSSALLLLALSTSGCVTRATMIGYREAQQNEPFYVAFLDGGAIRQYERHGTPGTIQLLPARVYRRDPTVSWTALAASPPVIIRGHAKPLADADVGSGIGRVRLIPFACGGIRDLMSQVNALSECVSGLSDAELDRRQAMLLSGLDSGVTDTRLLVACTTVNAQPCVRGGVDYTLLIGRDANPARNAAFPMLVGREGKAVSALVGVISFGVFFLWDFRRL